MTKRKIDLIYFDAGGGHRSAANALVEVIARQGRNWETRLVNLQQILDSLDLVRKTTGKRLEDVYNLMLKKGWTYGSAQLAVAMHGLVRLTHSGQVKLLTEFWRRSEPDMVVSLIPHFNRAFLQSLRAAPVSAPLVTVLTDIADYPPHFWIERQPQYLVCGSERAYLQAREMGHPESHVFRTSGMIVHPRFYDAPQLDRAAERKRLGLDPDLPTGLVLFGGEGSQVMAEIARRLERARTRVQLILICGRNRALAERLEAARGRMPMRVVGYTSEVPYYMQLSDFFIGKPGPGSISEALVTRLPVIVESNARTMPQERYNVQWIRERQVGLVVRSFTRIAGAVEELLQPGAYENYHARAAALKNRAVFEIPPMLEEILRRELPADDASPQAVAGARCEILTQVSPGFNATDVT